MRLNPKEEKALRNLVDKESTDRPVFLTQEEGSKLLNEIDLLREERQLAVRQKEELVKKYADDHISESIEEMLSEISVLRNEQNGLKDFLSTSKTMIARASRIPCSHDTSIFGSSSSSTICEHCEILKYLVVMIDKVEKRTT